MPAAQLVAGCIMALLAAAGAVYASFTARRKGPIFSNTYLFLSKKDRESADKNAEYKLVTVVFGALSAIFALLAVYIFTSWKWPYYVMAALIALLLIYVIADAVKTEKRGKG